MADGRFERALEEYQAWIAGDPAAPLARAMLSQTLVRLGRVEEAIASIDSARGVTQAHHGIDALQVVLRHALRGDREGMVAALTSEAAQVARTDETASWQLASAMAIGGDYEGALEWIGVMVDRGMWVADFVAVHDPVFAPLRGNPVFVALIAEMRRRAAEMRIPA